MKTSISADGLTGIAKDSIGEKIGSEVRVMIADWMEG